MAGGAGRQQIPRPSGARAGEPAPWAGLSPGARRVELASLRNVLRERRPADVPAFPLPQDHAQRPAAVLVPLYAHDGDVHVILTRRSAFVRSHRHEVSFPGGAREPGDADLWATACREAHEEIALQPAAATCIGELDPFFTVGSDSLVRPFVAELPAGRPTGLRPEPAEVEKILHVAVADLLAPGSYREELWPRDGTLRRISFFETPSDTIWGATAAILRQLLTLATTPATDAT